MALEFGFYDSMNGDRRYNTEQMSGIFEGLVNDGVYESVGDKFFVTPGSGLQVIVGTGRAWFHRTWNKNKAALPLSIDRADPAFARIDSVCLEVNAEDSTRANRIMIMKGNVALNPEPPIFPSTDKRVYWLRLANVRVRANTTSILASDINIRVGSSECPFVTSIVQQTNIDQLFAGWDLEFNTWWDSIKVLLNDNVATNLQNQITELKNSTTTSITTINNQLALIPNTYVKVANKATKADVENGTSDNKWVTPATLKDGVDKWGGIEELPIGRVILGFDFPTDKFLVCKGQQIVYKDYPELFSVVGYGASEDSIAPRIYLNSSGKYENDNGYNWIGHDYSTSGRAGCLLAGWSTVYNIYRSQYQSPSVSDTIFYYGMVQEYGFGYSSGWVSLGSTNGSSTSPYQHVSTGSNGRIPKYSTAGKYDGYVSSIDAYTPTSGHGLAGYFVDASNTRYHVAYLTSGQRTVTLQIDGAAGLELGSWKTNTPIFIFGTVYWENASGVLESFKIQTSVKLFPNPVSITLDEYRLISKAKRFRHSRDFKVVLAINDTKIYKLTLDSNSNVVIKELRILGVENYAAYGFLYNDAIGKVMALIATFDSRMYNTTLRLGIEEDDGHIDMSDNIFKAFTDLSVGYEYRDVAVIKNNFKDDSLFGPFSASMIRDGSFRFLSGYLADYDKYFDSPRWSTYKYTDITSFLTGTSIPLPNISNYAYIKALN